MRRSWGVRAGGKEGRDPRLRIAGRIFVYNDYTAAGDGATLGAFTPGTRRSPCSRGWKPRRPYAPSPRRLHQAVLSIAPTSHLVNEGMAEYVGAARVDKAPSSSAAASRSVASRT